MSTFFETKVSFLKTLDNGMVKRVSESFLVDAMSFTEAESKTIEEASADNYKEIRVESIKRSRIHEAIDHVDCDIFHKVKIQYTTIDDDSEKEKKITTYLLVGSIDCEEANEITKEHLSEMLIPYDIVAITSSPIVGVILHKP